MLFGSGRDSKHIDPRLDPEREEVERANRALSAFGSPHLLDANNALIDHPRHQEDARALRLVRTRRSGQPE